MKVAIRKTLARIFREDLGLKIGSLVAAIALFSLVHGAEQAQKAIYVDLITRVPDASSGRMLVSDLPVRVRLTVTGSRARLAQVRQDTVPPVQLDLRDTTRRQYEFSAADFELPLGVSVTEVDPAAVALEWAPRRERWLRIRPRLRGSTREGLTLSEQVVVEPESVLLVGPGDEVRGIDQADTTEIDLSTLSAGTNVRRVRLARPPEHTYFEEDGMITVTLVGVPERAERTLTRLDVAAVGAPVRGLRPTRVTVTLFGPPAVVQAIDPEQVVPFVDATPVARTRAPGLARVQVRGLPEGVEARRIAPPEVLVTPAP